MFNSDELNKINDQISIVLKQKELEADKVSKDILELERKLTTLSSSFILFYITGYKPCKSGAMDEDCLGWMHDRTKKRKRICYSLNKHQRGTDGKIHKSNIFYRPLIECDLNLRLKMYNDLAGFYKAFITCFLSGKNDGAHIAYKNGTEEDNIKKIHDSIADHEDRKVLQAPFIAEESYQDKQERYFQDAYEAWKEEGYPE